MEADPIPVDEHDDVETAVRAEEQWRELESAAAAGDWEAIGLDAPGKWEPASIDDLVNGGDDGRDA